MVLAGAATALKKAELVKEKLLASLDLITGNEAWVLQQQLLKIYPRILVLDLEYALDKKVEQDLWNHGFKNFIGALQAIVKDKKNVKRNEGQAMLHWCLEAASGFYLSLLQEVTTVFDLDLPFRRRGVLYGCSSWRRTLAKDKLPTKCSSLYICQYCLVHLGDIARYRNQNRQAETFYRYAVMVSPTSGQPYNQLAILEANRGDKLSMVYHYVRAVALSHPFPAAATNLGRALDKHAQDPVRIDGNTKLSSHEYFSAFLKLHGLLHSYTDLESAEKLIHLLTTSLTAHIATESFSAWKLVQIVVINLFALDRVRGKDLSPVGCNNQLTQTESHVCHLLITFLVGCLNAFLLPVYTIKSETAFLDFFAMPAIKLTLEWIRVEPEVLDSPAFHNRMQVWPSLCRLLNQLRIAAKGFPSEKYEDVPLPEDRDLQAFLPFESSFSKYKFHKQDLKTDVTALNKLRACRVILFGNWLTTLSSPQLISNSMNKGGDVDTFEPVGRPDVSSDILKELEQLSLKKMVSPVLSDGDSQTRTSTPDSSNFLNTCLTTNVIEPVPEKRPGILKSELSTEKLEGKQAAVGAKTGRNVALNTLISQKLNEEIKQVTFKTPSPPSKEKVPKVSPFHKKGQNNVKQLKAITTLRDTTVNSKDKTTDVTATDTTLLQQQKLMQVLAKEESNNIQLDGAGFPPLKDTNKQKDKLEKTHEKQQLLSVLFDKKSMTEQPKIMSGLLNLSKQQQELLTISKHEENVLNNKLATRAQQQQPIQRVQSNTTLVQQKVVDKMEAARKEYEDAMFILQQRKQEQPDFMRFQERDAFNINMPPLHAPPPQAMAAPPIFMTMNQPVMTMPPFAFKYPQELMMPWGAAEPPPMPPSSWWTDRHCQPPPPRMEPPGYNQAPRPAANLPQLSTYSLFNNPMPGESDPNYQLSGRLVNQQSFWTGPGPSPLERLLLQQRKQMRDAPPNT